MSLNDVDNRGSTPLHWACYSKSEFALSYILAMNPNLEIQDLEGLTPLHLAIKSVADLKSTRPVRALLLKGASRSAKTKKNSSCMDMIINSYTVVDPWTMMVKSIYTSIANCTMLRSWRSNYFTIWTHLTWMNFY